MHLTLQEANFPRDFGVDTLAGILGVDPPSFGGRGRGLGAGRWGGRGGAAAVEEERKLVMAFLEKWKAFDWTSELDGELKCFVDWGAHNGTAEGAVHCCKQVVYFVVVWATANALQVEPLTDGSKTKCLILLKPLGFNHVHVLLGTGAISFQPRALLKSVRTALLVLCKLVLLFVFVFFPRWRVPRKWCGVMGEELTNKNECYVYHLRGHLFGSTPPAANLTARPYVALQQALWSWMADMNDVDRVS